MDFWSSDQRKLIIGVVLLHHALKWPPLSPDLDAEKKQANNHLKVKLFSQFRKCLLLVDDSLSFSTLNTRFFWLEKTRPSLFRFSNFLLQTQFHLRHSSVKFVIFIFSLYFALASLQTLFIFVQMQNHVYFASMYWRIVLHPVLIWNFTIIQWK